MMARKWGKVEAYFRRRGVDPDYGRVSTFAFVVMVYLAVR
jgi:hypothetical protein